MLLPITLPTAMSAWPAQAELRPTASSGELVPNATTVRPTTRGEMPSAIASRDAPRTSSSAPASSTANPAASSPIAVTSTRHLRSSTRRAL